MGTWYNYKCGSCGKHCHKKSVLRCNFCNIPLCWTCRKGGLCPDHFKQLTTQERMELNSAHLTFTWLFRIAFWISIFAIIGAIGLLVNSETGKPVNGIISGAIGIVSCFICFKSPQWETNKMDKIRMHIRQRLGGSSGTITVENILRAAQQFPGGLNLGTKPVQNMNPPPISQSFETQISDGNFIICPNCAAKMVEGTMFCGICGKPMQ